MKKDNRGVSLVEIIIVVAIMTVVASGLIVGIGMVSGKPAQKCAQKLVFSLEKHRTTAMGKVSASYELYLDGASGQIMVKETVEGSTKVVPMGEKGVAVSYKLGGMAADPAGLTAQPLTSSPLNIDFKRGSGALAPVPGSTDVYVRQIIVTKGEKEFIVDLVPLTGKVSLKK